MFEDEDLLSIQEVRSKVEKAYAAWQNTGNCKDVSGSPDFRCRRQFG